MKTLAVTMVCAVVLAVAVSAQEAERFFPKGAHEYTPKVSEDLAKQPTPRLPDGRPDLSGPWVGGGSNQDIERDGGLKPGELPLLPAARALRDARNEKDEPLLLVYTDERAAQESLSVAHCAVVHREGTGHIFFIHENGDAGAHRQIFMDGRKHPDPDVRLPTWWGHSIGWWEGDTLVIDTVGYNDKFWFDSRGTPHSEQLHTVERWTRVNYGTLRLDLTLDDPGTLSRPVQLRFTATALPPGEELMEFVCTENNQYGVADGIGNPLAK